MNYRVYLINDQTMRIFLLCLALLVWPFWAFAQAAPQRGEKGAIPHATHHSSLITHHSTRAVVVGISDYQHPTIPDLRFADRDAEAFANFLRSPAGGSLDDDHLKVLTNQNATAGRIAEALDALVEQTNEGDQVIIYFSGHGDVERKTISQPGFLLCWDSPARVYMGGGTYSLAFLQEIVTTLSTQNKAKVVVVTDACHAGKLAGSQIGGAQITGANLAQQYFNEVKILSCQPNEYSIEGEQWGGGRGVFSYHLVDGLFGLADLNADGWVTVGEMTRYLEDRVTPEVAPLSQVPMLRGNSTERLAAVDAKLLADLKAGRISQMKILSPIEVRGVEDEVLSGVDSSVRVLYGLFKKALNDKVFLEPDGACADAFFEKLMAEQKLERLHNSIRRNYAALLQDDAQQMLNRLLLVDMAEVGKTRKRIAKEIQNYPRQLRRAAALLGEHHYFYKSMVARSLLFEGLLILQESSKSHDSDKRHVVVKYLKEAMQWQPEDPVACFLLSLAYRRYEQNLDSAEYYVNLSQQYAPQWTFPMGQFAYDLTTYFRQFDRAKTWLDKAFLVDTNSLYLKNQLGIWLAFNQKIIEADSIFRLVLEKGSPAADFLNTYGYTSAMRKKFDDSESAFLKCIEVDSLYLACYQNLANLYLESNMLDKAEVMYQKAIEQDSSCTLCFSGLGIVYNMLGRNEPAITALSQAISVDSSNIYAWVRLGKVYLDYKDYAVAKKMFETAIGYSRGNPFVAFAYSGLGIALENMAQFQDAVANFERALQVDRTHYLALTGMARVSLNLNNLDQAEKALKNAFEISPDGLVHYQYARYHIKKEDWQKGIEFMEKAFDLGYSVTLEQLDEDKVIAPIKVTPEWKALMKKHFPDKVKD